MQNMINEWVQHSNALTITLSATYEQIEYMKMCNAWKNTFPHKTKGEK